MRDLNLVFFLSNIILKKNKNQNKIIVLIHLKIKKNVMNFANANNLNL